MFGRFLTNFLFKGIHGKSKEHTRNVQELCRTNKKTSTKNRKTIGLVLRYTDAEFRNRKSTQILLLRATRCKPFFKVSLSFCTCRRGKKDCMPKMTQCRGRVWRRLEPYQKLVHMFNVFSCLNEKCDCKIDVFSEAVSKTFCGGR